MTTLDTINVTVQPDEALKVMREFDRRGEVWNLIETGPDRLNSMTFMVEVAHGDSGMEIHLKSDGTWSMTAPLILGEKQ